MGCLFAITGRSGEGEARAEVQALGVMQTKPAQSSVALENSSRHGSSAHRPMLTKVVIPFGLALEKVLTNRDQVSGATAMAVWYAG